MATNSAAATNVVPLRQGRDDERAQLPLLPLRIDAEFDAQFKSADLKKIVRAMDGHFYALKSQDDHPLLPASEFICYRLASVCQVAVPFSGVLTDVVGVNYFGSRLEGATTEWTALGPSTSLEMFKESAPQVSATLAFDLFVGNEDRHRGNFLFRKNHQDKWAPLAIDYSRAFLVQGFPNEMFPMAEASNTRLTIKLMKAADIFSAPHAVWAVGALQQVSREHLRRWCDEMPQEWLPDSVRKDLIAWWGSPAFSGRLAALYSLL